MKCVRFKCDYVENPAEYMVIFGLVDENDMLIDMDFFGYVFDETEDGIKKYPFTVNRKGKYGLIFWGSQTDELSFTNIFDTKIEIGQFVTRVENNVEYVYRIVDIIVHL